MNNAQEADRRIVSKSTYAQAQGMRLGLILFAAIVCALGIALPCWVIWQRYHEHGTFHNGAFIIAGLFPTLFAMQYFLNSGKGIIKKAKRINPGIPLTRANAADLPAPTSLVRASQEPAQTQEAVLLRAAAQTGEKHEGQLLRAAAGQEQPVAAEEKRV